MPSFKKIFPLFVILFFFNTILFAQNKLSQQTISRLDSFRKNVQIAIGKNDSLSIARAYYKLAIKFDYSGISDSADIYYNKALSIAYKLKNNKAIAVISNSLATTYGDNGLHSKAIKVYSDVVKRFLELSDTSEAASVMLNISEENIEMGKLQKALEIALEALKMRVAVSDSNNITAFHLQIGTLFNLIGNKQKWKEYISIADSLVKVNKKYGDFYRRMDILSELGAYYLSENNYLKAESYFDTLLTKSKKRDYPRGIVTSINNLIPIFIHQKKYKRALSLAKKAITISKKIGSDYKVISSLQQSAKLEIKLGEVFQAKKHLKEAERLAIKNNFPNKLIKIYLKLAEINAKEKNYKNAFLYSQKYVTLKDSLNNIETKKTITELETKYQSERKDKQIALLNKENLIQQVKLEKHKRTVIIIVILSLLSLLLLALFYYHNKLKNRNRILDLNNKLLRTQMNPHFMFNALLAIQNYILKNKKFEASDYLSKFASLMRNILISSRKDFISLKSEIELLKYYVELQQLRFENSFNFLLEVDENIDTEALQIPPMIIQPFIENAIEHGFKTGNDYDKILIVNYFIDNNFLIILIKDNGIGIEHSNKNKTERNHKSFAIEITKERILNIKKMFGEEIKINVTDLTAKGEKGTEIKFEIPLTLLKKQND